MDGEGKRERAYVCTEKGVSTRTAGGRMSGIGYW